ncbi:protein of unknown function [Clostridium beijerinckii]|nr:protein of unknown function [Clostridium beijerinckii]
MQNSKSLTRIILTIIERIAAHEKKRIYSTRFDKQNISTSIS